MLAAITLLRVEAVQRLVGIEKTIHLTMEIDDAGGAVNSYLQSERGGISQLEELGSLRAGAGMPGSDAGDTAEALGWNVIVKDERGDVLWGDGEAEEPPDVHVTIPLPGLRKGAMEVSGR